MAQRIQKFGDVNPMAVEAYEAMEGRYSFIIQQRDDMLAARDDLTQTIEAIEKKRLCDLMSLCRDTPVFY